ncbi:MAG: tRNA (adenosine(37)-N6)-threonylcarbamoyltransferase complex dimerization subunit type 1 TsaB [Meiothermus silvanus]|nr:tRNA (adenosine(37)-N6)-threonylcarbamoyltransferase complex dimerization subunit type 1 TsaB [Allomeiothermus silvanus]
MRVLALDTATPYLVLGLNEAERAVRLGRRHAEALWTELEAFLADCRTSLREIEGIAVGQGPGSYTGLRIGVSAGLGLAPVSYTNKKHNNKTITEPVKEQIYLY